MADDSNAIEIVNRVTRPLWDEHTLAKVLDKSVRTLQAERQRGTGIPSLSWDAVCDMTRTLWNDTCALKRGHQRLRLKYKEVPDGSGTPNPANKAGFGGWC